MKFMATHSPIACLSKAALFTDLPTELKEELVSISTHRQKFGKGSIIRRPLDGKDGMIVIDQGKAKVYNLSKDGKEVVLGILNKGDIEGQQHLFKQSKNENYIEALEDTWVCSIKRNDFQDLLQKTPDLSLNLLNNFGEKLVVIEHNSVLRNTLDAKKRIMFYLNDLANKSVSNEVELQLKKKDLASYLGITPETFSRKLKELEKDGKIKVNKRKIQILDNKKAQL